MGVSRARSWRRKNGEVVQSQYRYYYCQRQVNSFQGECKSRHASSIENLVLESIQGRDFWREALKAMESEQSGKEPIQQIELDIKKTEKHYLDWIQKASDGIMSIRQLAVKFAELDLKRAGLERKKVLYAGDRQSRTTWLAKQIRKIETEWDQLDSENRKELLQKIIRRVTVFDSSTQVLPLV